jgi:hypothetical protein
MGQAQSEQHHQLVTTYAVEGQGGVSKHIEYRCQIRGCMSGSIDGGPADLIDATYGLLEVAHFSLGAIRLGLVDEPTTVLAAVA